LRNSGPIQIIVCDNRIRQMNSFRSVKVNKTTDLSGFVVCRVEYGGGRTSYYAHQVLCHFGDQLDGKVSITLNPRKIIGIVATRRKTIAFLETVDRSCTRNRRGWQKTWYTIYSNINNNKAKLSLRVALEAYDM